MNNILGQTIVLATGIEELISLWRTQQLTNQAGEEQIYIPDEVHTNTPEMYRQYGHEETHSDTQGYDDHYNVRKHDDYNDRSIDDHTDNSTGSYDNEPGYDRHRNTDGGHSDDHRNTNGYTRHGNTGYDDYSQSGHERSSGRYGNSGYSRHSDSTYSEPGRDYKETHLETADDWPHRDPHTRLYTEYDRTAHRDTHTDTHADNHSDGILPYTESHTDRHTDTHRDGNRYTPPEDTGYSERTRHSDEHTDTDGRDKYNETHRNTHRESTGYDQYRQSRKYDEHNDIPRHDQHINYAGEDTYTPAVDIGFDHVNFIPQRPAIYDFEAGKTIVDDVMGINLASYDHNTSGAGSQYPESRTVKYEVKIKKLQDIDGNNVADSYHVVTTNETRNDFTVDIADFDDGLYQMVITAYNDSPSPRRTEKYRSRERVVTFTIANHSLPAELTVANFNEFYSYVYGLETYKDRAGDIQKYVDKAIYSRADEFGYPQKGLFLLIEVKDEDINTYHKVYAGLQKGAVSIAESADYEVVFPTDKNGYTYPGDKTVENGRAGYVFIPLSDMMDNGTFEDVYIKLDINEYSDAQRTIPTGFKGTVKGLTSAKDVIYISIDNKEPTVNITDPLPKNIVQHATITAQDGGLGLHDVGWKAVRHGASQAEIDNTPWIPIGIGAITSKTVDLKTAGSYDIYAYARDQAGNTSGPVYKGTFDVAQLIMSLTSPSVTKPDDPIDVSGKIITDLEIEKAEFYIDNSSVSYAEGLLAQHIDLGGGMGNYTYTAVLPTPFRAGEIHNVYLKVTFRDVDDPSFKDRLLKIVSSYGEVIGAAVGHTKDWDAKRIEKGRAADVFWAGEAFVCSADISFDAADGPNAGCLLKKVTIEEYPQYVLDFTSYINAGVFDAADQGDGTVLLHQEDQLWEESMFTTLLPGELTFRFEFTDGTVLYRTVYIDEATKAFRYHRAQ